MYFLSLDELTQAFWSGVRTLFYSICTLVYKLIIYLYNLFDMLCTARILDNEFMEILYFRVGLILGLIMFFRICFSFVQMLLNPDTINDKEKGAFNIVKRVLITIVLLGIVPYIFDTAYKVQDIVMGNNTQNANVIARLLLPVTINTDDNRFGEVFSEQLFFAFYDLDERNDHNAQEYQDCANYQIALRNEIENTQEFTLGYNCLNQTMNVVSPYSNSDETVYVMRFDYLFSLLVGVLVCWFLLTYCFSVGVRVVQLAFLQIIAPMAVISYISPKKDGLFNKWVKLCFSTYIDMFIRVAIINFVVLLIAIVMDGFFGESASLFLATSGAYAAGPWYRRFLFVIIVLSLLQFAKKAPELIKELMPNSKGDFGFSLKNREMLGRGLAAVGGVAAGGLVGLASGFKGGNNIRTKFTGAVGGLLGGAGRGIVGGVKSKGGSLGDITKVASDTRKKQAAVGLNRAQRLFNGVGYFSGLEDRVTGAVGIMSDYEKYSSMSSTYDTLMSSIDSDKRVKGFIMEMNNATNERDFNEAKKKRDMARTVVMSNFYGDLSSERGLLMRRWEQQSGMKFNFSSLPNLPTGESAYEAMGNDAAGYITAYASAIDKVKKSSYDPSSDYKDVVDMKKQKLSFNRGKK